MRALLRRAWYGSLLAFPILLRWAAGRTPTEIAASLFGARARVYRSVRAYRTGSLGGRSEPDGQLSMAVPSTIVMPWLTRSRSALLQKAPRAYGWCRTRWRWATLALTLPAHHGSAVSAETVRRWLHEIGWVWKRATLAATEDDPQRGERLAWMRWPAEQWPAPEGLGFADARDIPLVPKVGAAWMPKAWMPTGPQGEVRPPGTNAKPYVAGALKLTTGVLPHGLGPRKTHALFRDLLTRLDHTYPTPKVPRLSGVVDNDRIHKAQAVEQGLRNHPRFVLLGLPTSGPRANPLARAFGDGQDKGTRHHTRKRLRDLGQDVERHVQAHGPWKDKLSRLYDAPAGTAVVERLAAAQQLKTAACVYESHVG